ncbi:MAG: hypothetical protein ACI9K2_006806, partial [Myxococcota bacterium]
PRAAAPRGRPTRKAKASSSRQAPPKPPPAEPGARLAAAQSADGSFGGDVARTAAALLALVLLGHTRRRGNRSRTVRKAASWLATQSGPLARAALHALTTAEAGTTPAPSAEWQTLEGAGAEGAALRDARS